MFENSNCKNLLILRVRYKTRNLFFHLCILEFFVFLERNVDLKNIKKILLNLKIIYAKLDIFI